METPFTYGNPLLFLTPIWVELPSDPEVAVLLKPLSYALITKYQETLYMHQQDSSLFKYNTSHVVLEDSVIDTRNALDFPDIKTFLKQLPLKDVQFLHVKTMELSVLTSTQLDALGDMLNIQFSPQFQEDSWNCNVCREKKLDYTRGCGFLPENERDPSPALPRLGMRRFSVCPISTLDGYVVNKASLCYSMLTEGVLPEAGGVGEQSEWFIKVALLYKRKIAEAERNALEEHKKKNK
jgi:hypothetical protein